MAIVDMSALTMNPLEAQTVSEWIQKAFLKLPQVQAVLFMNGVTMKTQVISVERMGMSGIASTGCTRVSSGAVFALTEKYLEPSLVEDTFENCVSNFDSLFKAYFTKITRYEQLFNISGSDVENLIFTVLMDSMEKAFFRLLWMGNKAAAVSGAATPGLINAGDVKFFNSANGLWVDIFADVALSAIPYIEITENEAVTKAAQLTFADGAVEDYLDKVKENSSTLLRTDPSAKFYISHDMFSSFKRSLRKSSKAFTLETVLGGIPAISFDGNTIVDMELYWDMYLKTYFEGKNDHSIHWLPNRIVYAADSVFTAATLAGKEGNVESWYDQDKRVNKMAYLFTLDSKVNSPELVSVAY